jgi:hypothetical protein
MTYGARLSAQVSIPLAPDWAVVGQVGLLGRPELMISLGFVLFDLFQVFDLYSNFVNSYLLFQMSI